MTHPIQAKASALAFQIHPEVAKAIFQDGWMFQVTDEEGVSHKLDQNLTLVRSEAARLVFESRTKVGGIWIRMRARFTSNSPWASFWIWPIAGDETMSEPLIRSRSLVVEVTVEPTVPRIGITPEGLYYLHGQGAGITKVQVDFEKGDSINTTASGEFDYAPYHPNQTGGKHLYMGITFPAGIPLGKLYAVGGYGGHFQRATGTLTREEDHPKLQADSHIHEHSTDRGWIHYTFPETPWRDRLLGFQANQDHEHYCLFRPVAQTLQRSDDEGLRMLCEAAAHVFLRQTPETPRGTSHHLSGDERAQGRILLTGIDLYEALHPTTPDLANLVGARILARNWIDMEAFRVREEAGEPGFAHWSPGKLSPSEIGIHYWGAFRLQELITKMQGFGLRSLQAWIESAREFCFRAFRYYDFAGDRHWAVPYAMDLQGNDVTGPASSSHFAWLAATHYQPKNPTEHGKRDQILRLGEGYDERFKS